MLAAPPTVPLVPKFPVAAPPPLALRAALTEALVVSFRVSSEVAVPAVPATPPWLSPPHPPTAT